MLRAGTRTTVPGGHENLGDRGERLRGSDARNVSSVAELFEHDEATFGRQVMAYLT